MIQRGTATVLADLNRPLFGKTGTTNGPTNVWFVGGSPDLVAGVYPKVMIDGDMDAGAWSCGMVAGLIHDIPTVKELIDRIMTEAEQLIRGRLTGFLDDDAPSKKVA